MTASLSAQHPIKVVDKKGRPLEIRLLDKDDEEKLFEFFGNFSLASREHFQPHPFTTNFVAKMVKDRHAAYHLRAVVQDPKNKHAIVGYAFLTCPPFMTQNAYFGIGVADDYQGRGISSLLMTQLFAYAQQKQVKKVYLNVYGDNKAAIAAYFKQGFEEIPAPLLLSKIFTLYELWYNGAVSELFKAKTEPTTSKEVVWMAKDLI